MKSLEPRFHESPIAMTVLFKGLSAFPITPTDPDGHVDTDGLCLLLSRLTSAKVDSVGLLGSTGTYAYLDRAERKRAVAAAAECLNGMVPLVVGIGALRTDVVIALAQDAKQAGADAILLAPVSYTPLTDEEVFQHYAAVAADTDLPLCIYNNPGTTHFTFDTALIGRLSRLPGIVAVKMPLPSATDITRDLAGLRDVVPKGFQVGYSGDWGCAAALLAGADTWFSVVAGLFPVPAVALNRAAQEGDAAEVDRIDRAFWPLWDLFKAFGSLRVIYAVANELGLTEATLPRPLLPLSPALQPRIVRAIQTLGNLA